MKVKIKDKRFINPTLVLEKFITEPYKSGLLKGLSNLSKITEDDIFEATTYFQNYVIIENKNGSFVVRYDNLTEYDCIENTLQNLGIKKVINSKDLTILIGENGDRYFTKKHEDDENDIEKAVMMLLLKKEGYKVKDIYNIIASVQYK